MAVWAAVKKKVGWPILATALLGGWVAGISYSHGSLERAGRTTKGAGELLQIGALPVT